MGSKRTKLVLAMVGTGAVLAMGGLTLALDGDYSAQQSPAVASAERTADETSTKTTARGVPETSVAVPPITTPPYTIPTGEPQ